MIVVTSKNGAAIRLSQERWRHITGRHPELESQKESVLQTITSPDLVQQGELDTLLSAKFFPETPLTRKFLVVIYKELGEADGFVLTTYFTNQLSKRRRVLWSR